MCIRDRVYCDDRLVLIAHHLVVDAISWGIVVEDLQCLYDGTPLPPASLPFATWARRGHSTPGTPQPNHQGVVRTMVRTPDLDPVQATDLVEGPAEVLGEPRLLSQSPSPPEPTSSPQPSFALKKKNNATTH